jgi:hypothetical protein
MRFQLCKIAGVYILENTPPPPGISTNVIEGENMKRGTRKSEKI